MNELSGQPPHCNGTLAIEKRIRDRRQDFHQDAKRKGDAAHVAAASSQPAGK
ncbi:hypothetical protein [Paraburkholderia sp. Cy-641]|uniref:hypothetical protein n=1 Tax=Paraburkholderia sp. Cy-641 TaxID=2608337 RepID=UPI0014225414|nr:hypothetical protein [Paraburkholderia sp. Cy-641]